MKASEFLIQPGSRVDLKKISTKPTNEFPDKESAKEKLAADIEEMARLQDIFHASGTYSLLIVFQAPDAAGKDGAIKHVMSGLNPQGTQVSSFKSPSSLELSHDYLWRCKIRLPERGRIGIFNRSYYEEVLVVRVHPSFLKAQKIPEELVGNGIWKRRYEEINQFEKYLTNNGTRVLKFFLNLSKEEQKNRFMERIENPAKNWKLSPSDVQERAHWDQYREAYEAMLTHTSTEWAPWYAIPADKKWFARTAIADVVVNTLHSLKLDYPKLDGAGMKRLEESKALLLAEKD